MLSIIEKYYNKHKEDLRLQRRHGIVEFRVSMKYILDYLPKQDINNYKISDIGAGTGKYSDTLFKMGFDVTAVELVKHNIDILKKNNPDIRVFQGNALDLKMLKDNEFDFTINFGPLYHLHTDQNKLKALNEAKRITKPGGLILNAYVLNDYSILTFCFHDNKIVDYIKKGVVDKDFKIHCSDDELYDYVRLDDINRLNEAAGLQRVKIFSPDGPSDFMRTTINEMSEECFEKFIEYQIVNAEREELLGAGSHLVDIVKNIKN